MSEKKEKTKVADPPKGWVRKHTVIRQETINIVTGYYLGPKEKGKKDEEDKRPLIAVAVERPGGPGGVTREDYNALNDELQAQLKNRKKAKAKEKKESSKKSVFDVVEEGK